MSGFNAFARGGLVNDIAQNIRRIQERAAKAAISCGRAPDEITLLAISKTFPAESILQAAEAGLHRFGENRVQEAEGKILRLRQTFKPGVASGRTPAVQ